MCRREHEQAKIGIAGKKLETKPKKQTSQCIGRGIKKNLPQK